MIRVTDQYFWNFVFALFFLTITGTMAVIVLSPDVYKPLPTFTPMDLVLIVLATHRLIRLFVYDVITKFFREQFYDAETNKRGEVMLYKPPHGPRRTLADLLSCPWCFGVWAAAVTVFLYAVTPYTYYFVLLLAVASVATTLQLTTNLIGHRAEQLKHQNDRGY